MMKDLVARLAGLRGIVCQGIDAIELDEPSYEPAEVRITVAFSDGTRLDAEYWRVTKVDGSLVSNFDHRQKYGLPERIDAVQVLRNELSGRQLVTIEVNPTADLRLSFEHKIGLEVFNFTGYEAWQLTFPDGTFELSNFALLR
jgi:hypothetical protein